MKISHNGHSVLFTLSSASRGLRFACRTFFLRMRDRRLADPRAVVPRLHAGAHPIAIARAVAFENVVELAPIDRPEIVMPTCLVPFELGIGHRDAEKIRLRNRLIDDALPELAVRQQL